MKKINVLYVIWSLGLGGAEQVIINLIKGIDKDKFQPFVCCLNDKGPFAGELEQLGVKIFALHKKPGADLATIGKIKKILKEKHIDIIHPHLWGANFWGRLAAKAAGTKTVVITEHNVDVWKKWYHKILDRFLACWTDKIIVVSNQVKKFYVENVGIADEKLEVVYNGIPLNPKLHDAEENLRLKEELDINNTKPVLSNIGRLVPAKANHIFLETLRHLDKKGIDFNALIIGDGPLKESLIEQGKDLIEKKCVKFTGLRKDISKILDITDVSVLSSTREGFSIVVLESMAKGIPFVATNVGGNDEQIIDGETGFLTPVNDAKALADSITKILQNPELKQKMGQAAEERLTKNFALNIMVRQTEDLYLKIL